MPQGDFWKLVDNDYNSQHYGKEFKFNFSKVDDKDIKKLLKKFVWRNYREQNLSINTLYRNINFYLPNFLNFIKQNNINSLTELTNNDVDMFLSYLNTLIKPDGERYSLKYRKNCLDVLKSIIRWGQLYMPDKVPKVEIFTGNEYKGVNKKLKVENISDEVLKQINEAIAIEEEHIYIKYAIVIFQGTGMRMGELLNLETDCIVENENLIEKAYGIKFYDYKNRKYREIELIPEEIKIAVERLIEHTKKIREEADGRIKDKLFIHKITHPNPYRRVGEINKITDRSMEHWFQKFIKKHKIRDTDGNLFDLKSHQFRRTLGSNLLSESGDINLVQQALGLASAANAKRYYARTKDSKKAEIFNNIGILGNIKEVENFVDDKKELEWFKKNKDTKARMEDGYCTKPIENGKFCDRLLKRKKCLTCKRFITTPEFLETHREYLRELELELENNIYGEHYAEHLRPTIEVLREIIKRLERLKSESKATATNHKRN